MTKEWKTGEENDYYVRTCAWSPPGCHPVGCGLKLHIKDGKLVGVEGDEEHPITKGRLCVRCLSLPEYVNHPSRILYPMKRDYADRGKNKWTRISWDEALDIIEEKVKYFKEKYGPESIVVFGGTGRQATLYYPPLAYAALQTPNACYPWSGFSCYGPRVTIANFILGAGYPEVDFAGYYPDRYDHPGYHIPEYLILWGKMPLFSNPDGFFGHAVIDMMKLGTRVISVDPRVNWLATRAAYHLQLRPGTDTALALGMLNVIINEELYDKEFVEKWCYGFDKLRERVQEYPLDKVSEITWVPAKKIAESARAFAKAEHASIQWGVAIDESPNGVQAGHAILALLAITGNLDNPGGVTLGPRSSLLGKWRYETNQELTPELWNKRLGYNKWPAYFASMSVCHPDEALDTLETDVPYPLRMGWFNSSNFIAPTCSACPDRWFKALQKLEFCVGQDVFMNPTIMAFCELFLPLSTFAELDGIVQTHFGRNASTTGAINKALSMGDTKSDLEVAMLVGKRLNPKAWPWETPEEFFDAQLKPHFGFDFNELREKGVHQGEFIYHKYEKGLLREDGEPGFNTVTGLVELASTLFESWGEDPLPYYEEPPFSPVSTPKLFEQYPLILTTGARKVTSFHAEHRQLESLREIDEYPEVEIHPDTAKKLGIAEGDWVVIENMFGSCKEVAHLTTTIDPRVVHATHGWWYPEQDGEAPNLFGVWKSNINLLIPHKTIGKLGFGTPAKCLICRVYRAEHQGIDD